VAVPAPAPSKPAAEPASSFYRKLQAGQFVVSVEIDPPKGLDPTKDLQGARLLRDRLRI